MQQINQVVKFKVEIVKVTDNHYFVQSEKYPMVSYEVKCFQREPKTCTCPDYMHRGLGAGNPNHVCKHMKRIIEAENNGDYVTAEEKIVRERLQYEDGEDEY